MLGQNSGQLEIIDLMIYEQLIPEDHILREIDKTFDFTFVYELVADKYSNIGRLSIDPLMLVKIFLLEYLYVLSDVKVIERTQTDMAFRWFLGLSIYDLVPDDTTLSYFRIHRLGLSAYDMIFDEIILQCIDKKLVNSFRFQIDTTDVAANVNYPSDKKIIRQAYNRLIKEVKKFDVIVAKKSEDKLDKELEKEYAIDEKISAKRYYEIIEKHILKFKKIVKKEIKDNDKLRDTFELCDKLIDQKVNRKPNKIISIVDQEARVAYKSPGNPKTGYKNHILIDEDSEIILASCQTPFNVNDHKKFIELVEKVKSKFELKPREISADKGYVSQEIRRYLYEDNILGNINFYADHKTEKKYFTPVDCLINSHGTELTCPNGITKQEYRMKKNKTEDSSPERVFTFNSSDCSGCKLVDSCLKIQNGKMKKTKCFYIPDDYIIFSTARERTTTDEFNTAMNMRFKIERRFATEVNNHGLRRSRYIGLMSTSKHIIMSNLVTNIIRAINIINSSNDDVKEQEK